MQVRCARAIAESEMQLLHAHSALRARRRQGVNVGNIQVAVARQAFEADLFFTCDAVRERGSDYSVELGLGPSSALSKLTRSKVALLRERGLWLRAIDVANRASCAPGRVRWRNLTYLRFDGPVSHPHCT